MVLYGLHLSVTANQIVKFKYFSRPNGHFPAIFKADLISRDFKKTLSIFQNSFSALFKADLIFQACANPETGLMSIAFNKKLFQSKCFMFLCKNIFYT